MLQIDIANEQRVLKLDRRRVRAAARRVLETHGVKSAEISLAIVDDPAIHELNKRWLEHDYPTDVISFVLEQSDGRLEGEVIASAETAARLADEFGTPPHDELLLYVVHGLLHLVGFDDRSAAAAREMRAQEESILRELGVQVAARPATPKAKQPDGKASAAKTAKGRTASRPRAPR